MLRALPGAVSREGAGIVMLLSRPPHPAPFSCGGGILCGQEEVGECSCSVMGP